MHHPIYPFDDHHSESPAMADVLQHAINDSPRIPNLVLTGHVHNYQRIEKEILKGKPTPFVVAGNGGYFNLHRLTAKNGTTDQFTGATLRFGDDAHHGYVTLAVDQKNISGKYVSFKDNGNEGKSDKFKYPTDARYLPKNAMINL